MRNLGNDLSHAARRLLRTPMYTAFSALTLAIGLTAVTVVDAVLHSAVWRPVAIPHPEQVVNLGSEMTRVSWPDWQSLRAQQTSFSGMAGVVRFPSAFTYDNHTTLPTGEAVTDGYFAMMGVHATYGRTLGTADSAPQAQPVVVLASRLARSRFIDASDAVGQHVRIGGHSFQVVGVVGDDFPGIAPHFAASVFWIPIERATLLTPAPPMAMDPARRQAQWMLVKARVKEGVSLRQASEEVRLIGQGLDQAFPPAGSTEPRVGRGDGGWTIAPRTTSEADMMSNVAIAVLAGVGLVLLLVCVNLANLGLSRTAGRSGEFAIRRALGASRWRLIREQLMEAALVLALAAVATAWAVRWLPLRLHTDLLLD